MPGVRAERVARDFYRLGWLGVGILTVLGIIPLVVLAWAFFGTALGTGVTWSLGDRLAFVGLAILAFTAFWSYRYTRLAERIADPARRPPRKSIVNTLWVGLSASAFGILVSMLLLISEVMRLLMLVLITPQAGVPVIQTQTDGRAAWVSAIDVVSLLADVCTLAGELMVFGLSVWLLFRVVRAADDFDGVGPAAEG